MTNRKYCKHLKTFLRTNIVLGLVVAVAAIYYLITGDYASLAERRHTEGVLNLVMMGGITFSVLNWFVDLYFQPRIENCLKRA